MTGTVQAMHPARPSRAGSRPRRLPCVLVAASSLAWSCRGQETSPGAGSEGSAPSCAARVVTIEPDPSTPPLRIAGVVEPLRRATPAARVMAAATRADFHEGDRVRQGQLLVQLDTRDLATSGREARAARAATRTALDLARAHAKRMRALHATGDVARPELEQAEAALAQAEAVAASATSAVEGVEVNLSYARVIAPFDGVVALRLVEVGNLVAPGQPVAVIEDDTRLRVIAPIAAELATGIVPGREVTVEIAGSRAPARVEGVVSSGDARAPGLRLQLIVENGGGLFRPGMVAGVELPREGAPGTAPARVPRAAVFERGQLTGVFVVNERSEATLRWIVVAEAVGDGARVLSGLRPGERVAIAPDPSCLADGRRVQPLQP